MSQRRERSEEGPPDRLGDRDRICFAFSVAGSALRGKRYRAENGGSARLGGARAVFGVCRLEQTAGGVGRKLRPQMFGATSTPERQIMLVKKPKSAAAVFAVAVAACAGVIVAAEPSAEDRSPYQGWGLAISYEVIGERCAGALSADEIEVVKRFVAAGLADSKQRDSKFDHDKFAGDFRADMHAKYAAAGACSQTAIADARKAVATIRANNAAGR